MEYLTPLNIVMCVVLFISIVSVRLFLAYQKRLQLTILTVMEFNDVVGSLVSDPAQHKANLETAQKDNILYDRVWIPLCYTSMGLTIVMWFSMYMGLTERNDLWPLVVAMCVGAIMTRVALFNHTPKWLQLWTAEIRLLLATYEAEQIHTRMIEINKLIGELAQKAQDQVITQDEEQEVANLVMEAAMLNSRVQIIKFESASGQQ